MAAEDILWSCQALPLDVPLDSLTVGTPFALECQGPEITAFSSAVQFEFEPEGDSYSLYVLKVLDANSTNAKLMVTGYKPGTYKKEFLKLTDGTSRVQIPSLEWTVKSILQPTPGEMPKGFGAYGPFSLSFPWWFWSGLILVFLLLGLAVSHWARRRAGRRRLLERLKASRTALGPYNQFHKDLRQLSRRFHAEKGSSAGDLPAQYLRDLEKGFRDYLCAELLVPAQDWPDRALRREIKKRHRRVFDQVDTQLRITLSEFAKARALARLSLADWEQMQEMSRKLVDLINAHLQEKSQ